MELLHVTFTCRLAISRSTAWDISTTIGSVSWLPTVTLEAALSPTITAMIVSVGAGIATVTAAVPVAEPDEAVIVPDPSATEVTKPEEETVAIDVADVAHDTPAPPIVAPLWSLTVAYNCCVAPIDVKLKLVGERVIDVATGVGVVGVVGDVGVDPPPSPPPQDRRNSAGTSFPYRIP